MDDIKVGSKVMLIGEIDDGKRDCMTVIEINGDKIQCMWKISDGYIKTEIPKQSLKTPS
jgi:hypothetical protein